MVQIKWTRIATEDLKSIFDYIARDSNKFAKIESLFKFHKKTNAIINLSQSASLSLGEG